jgi:hypothetical protein
MGQYEITGQITSSPHVQLALAGETKVVADFLDSLERLRRMGCDRLFIVLSGLKIPVSGVQFSPCPPTPLNANAHFAVAAPQGARRAGSGLGLNLGVLWRTVCGSAPGPRGRDVSDPRR